MPTDRYLSYCLCPVLKKDIILCDCSSGHQHFNFIISTYERFFFPLENLRINMRACNRSQRSFGNGTDSIMSVKRTFVKALQLTLFKFIDAQNYPLACFFFSSFLAIIILPIEKSNFGGGECATSKLVHSFFYFPSNFCSKISKVTIVIMVCKILLSLINKI